MALVKVRLKNDFLPIEQLDNLRMTLSQFQPMPKFAAEAPFAGQSAIGELIQQAYIACDDSIAEAIAAKVQGDLNIQVKDIVAYDDPQNCPPGTLFCRICQQCRGVTESGHCQACGNQLR